jgi:hypothetical protein
MSSKVALMGYHPTMTSRGDSIYQIMGMLGQNTGNLAFWHAVERHIANEKLFVSTQTDPDWVNREASVLVLPAANFIGVHMDLTPYVDFLGKINIPILILGLGTQFSLDNDQQIGPSSERFLQVIKDKDVTIAARGQITADFLASKGIDKCEVTGCPSNYINPYLKFKYEHLVERVLLNFQIGHNQHAAILPCVANWTEGNAYSFVWQGFEDPIAYLHDVRNYDGDLMAAYNECLRPGMPLEPFKQWLSAKSTFFTNAEDWMTYCAKFTLSVGTRFHGNMLAIQAGVPAVFVVHDSRTREMVDLFSLPHVDMQRIIDIKRLDRILANVNADMNPYLAIRSRLAKTYFSILENAGINVNAAYQSMMI